MIKLPTCRNPKLPPRRHTRKPPPEPARRVDIFGVDFAWSTPNPWELRKAGVRFAVTYLSRDTTKGVDRDYMRKLTRAGIGNVLVFEDAAQRALRGRSVGESDGAFIHDRLRELKLPAETVVYGTADFDWQGEPSVIDYFGGMCRVRNLHATGVYGGVKVVRAVLDKRLAAFGFQAYAWSDGQWDHRAQLRQYSNGRRLAGADVDFDRAVWSDFGQFAVR